MIKAVFSNIVQAAAEPAPVNSKMEFVMLQQRGFLKENHDGVRNR